MNNFESLFLVTFLPTGSQFIVNADDEKKVLGSAIKANCLIGEMEDTDLSDHSLYETEEITFDRLAELFSKGGYWGKTDDTIIFDED